MTSEDDSPERDKDAMPPSDRDQPERPTPPGASAFDFPVVGVGASAGGLEAYRKLLAAMPEDPGVAFVFVQHLDPSHKSMMADLLDRDSRLPVVEARDGMRIAPDHVYMIPPNTYLRLTSAGLRLDSPATGYGWRTPIDHFFRSLAETQQEKAICIVLSGAGSDGMQGLKEVKAAGGMAMVERPSGAKYDSMPRAAISTGMADFVLDIDAMPAALLDFVKQPYLASDGPRPGLSRAEPESFRAILKLLLAHTQYDFSAYKNGTLERRIQRRMGLRRITDAGDYLNLLREDAGELRALFRDLLIRVTRFFRDPAVWDALQQMVIRPLVAEKAEGEAVRVWVPGCASGEEAYTLAILFFEEFARQGRALPLQIYATDLDETAIERARTGAYPNSIAADLTPERVQAFFVAEDETLVVAKRLREAAVFATHNAITDPPFSRLDLISCRNLMIYLEPPVQRRLLELFHFGLRDDGVLLLGSAESSDPAGNLFEPVAATHRAFRRRPGRGHVPILPGQNRRGEGDSRRPVGGGQPESQIAETARKILLATFAPASVLVNRHFEPQYYHGQLRDYLDFPSGEPARELPRIALDGLASKLRAALNRALKQDGEVEDVAPSVRRADHRVAVRFQIRPVRPSRSREAMLLVSFFDEDVTEARAPPIKPQTPDELTAYRQLEYELQATQEDLQSTIEELEIANEELKASNEEAMSMNEELQSTNEELETSREELQSLNEELTTVNSQLEEKVDELEQANSDMGNLLASTDIATVFLDRELRIRLFTPAARELMNLIDGDVKRPISNLAPRVDDPSLLGDAHEVLANLKPREAEVTDDRGRAYLRRVQPYRTSDDRVEGVVVTLADVTRLRDTTADLRQRERQQAAVAELGQDALAGAPVKALLQKAARAVAECLDCQLSKVLEFDPAAQDFILRAGYGWPEGTIDTRVPGGTDSQAGYALSESGPVIVDDLAHERRFTGPALLRDNGVVSGISVIIGNVTEPWGVFGVHSTRKRSFSVDDVSFVQSAANLLSSIITRNAAQHERDGLIARLETVLDATRIATWMWLPDSDTAIWDKRMGAIIGIPDDAPQIGETFFQTVHPADREGVKQSLGRMLAGGEGYNAQFRVVMPDGEVRWVAGMGSEMTDGSGVRKVFGVNFDITDRIQSENLLSESEQRREMALEAANLGTWEWRPGEDYMVWDRRMFRITGMPPRDSVPIEEFRKRVHPDDWERRATNIRSALSGDGAFENTYRFYRDGDELWFTSTGRMFTGPSGTRIIGITGDSTHRKREEERRRMLMAELDHRVKNILANVNAIARQTGHSRPDPEEFIVALEGRLSAMADAHSLLSASHWEGVALGALLDAELSPYISDRADRVQVEGEDVLLSPKAAQSMSLFLHELVTNAAKYGALKHPEGGLSVGWSTRNGQFELIWTERSPVEIRRPASRGFGLSVIEDMTASDLNGEVTLDFRPGGLVCRLTAAVEDVAAAGRGVSFGDIVPLREWKAQSSAPVAPAARSLKILIVEDVWTVAMHLKDLLEEAGHEVVGPGARLDEALALAEIEDIDAAILDVRLNEQLVFPVAERLAERGIPFGFATGYADADIVPGSLSDRPLVSKPYGRDTISRLVNRLTGARRQGRA